MPAFTFEKISAPVRHSGVTESSKFESGQSEPRQSGASRGIISRMLDRFVASRVKHSLREEQAVMPYGHKKTGS